MNKATLIIPFFLSICAGFPANPVTAAVEASMNPGVQMPSGNMAAASTSAASIESQASYKNYTYIGDRYRDPFIPLNGDIRSDQQALERPPQIASLMLKGIVQDAKGRMALLTSGVSSYILKGGRLYDGRNKMVKKMAGVIKTDSVVIIGADRTVRELKTKSPL
jgi:hypothetical protein